MRSSTTPWILPLAGALLVSCQATSYTSFLKFGHHDPKDDLVACAQAAHDENLEAQEGFAAALNRFTRLTHLDAEDLGALYDDFSDDVEDCTEASEDLEERIQRLRTEGTALFARWNEELQAFTSPQLRGKSEAMLLDTRERHEKAVAALERTHVRMEPVIAKLRDYELFFHHNLNPRAIATLEDTYEEFVDSMLALTKEMGATREELDSFLEALDGRVMPSAETGGAATG